MMPLYRLGVGQGIVDSVYIEVSLEPGFWKSRSLDEIYKDLKKVKGKVK